MGLITHHDEPDATKDAPAATKNGTEVDPRVEARKHRIASLRRVAGIWADRTDIPADGLDYERELRDEWR